MSITGKKWYIKNISKDKSAFEKILENRNFSFENELKEFHDPYLFRDMEKTIDKILETVKKQERIMVFGDYDVDGITGTAILFWVLKELGANVSYRIPHRQNDGYGLSKNYINEFIEKNIKLLITVDCGISCYEEILYAKENGIEVIITDHHSIPAKRPIHAFAVIHPKEEDSNYPYSELTGAGVALKLAQAIIQKTYPQEKWEGLVDNLSDLASLGTVADLGPLNGENRLIVKKGLRALKRTKWLGLKKLMELSGIKEEDYLDTIGIGFKIAPRINAAGRIDNPYIALKLLLQREENKYTKILSERLEELNALRQKMTIQAVEEAEKVFLNEKEMPYILLAKSADWHIGIAGLVAGRLSEKYARPVIILQDRGDALVGSARSPEYFNVTDAIAHCKELLENFGGHAQAAGLNIKKENYRDFQEKISQYAENELKNNELKPNLQIDCEVGEQDINYDLLNKIDTLEPFGVEHEKPSLLLNNRKPLFINRIGKEGQHLRFSIAVNNEAISVIGFNMGEHSNALKIAENIDIVFNLDRNIWNNKESIQLKALDISINQG